MRSAMAVEGCSGVYAGHKMRANVEQCGQDAFATSAESGGFAGASCRCRGECNVVWTGLYGSTEHSSACTMALKVPYPTVSDVVLSNLNRKALYTNAL